MTLASVLAEGVNPRTYAVLGRFLTAPAQLPGVNNVRYRHQAGTDLPVLLLPGALVNFGANFGYLARSWSAARLPLYAVNYGQKPWSLGRIGGLTTVAESVQEIAPVIDRLRRRTGAPAVNLVGHSVGALVGLAYLNTYGPASVHAWVGLGPCLHGTTVRNIFSGPHAQARHRLLNRITHRVGAPGLADIVAGSAFTTALWQDYPEPPTSVRYLTVRTQHDNSVTPLATQVLPGPAATNVLLQDVCPENLSNHRTMITDGCVAELVVRFLRGQPLRCTHRGEEKAAPKGTCGDP